MPPPALTAASLELPGIAHGFFTRQGGVSKGIYASLNCGFGSSDEREHVAENRLRACDALGGAGGRIVTPYQVHGADVIVAETLPPPDAVMRADAVVTRTRGLVIGVLTADCVPVLFADPVAGIVAAAHAGWRGAVAGVIENTVQTMLRLGATPQTIRAAIGPAISQPAYEVGPEFRDEILTAGAAHDVFFALNPDTGRPHFDLPAFVRSRLRACGISETGCLDVCTHAAESNFFSYRRSRQRNELDYGRQISAIVLH